MSNTYRVTHLNTYSYSEPVSLCHNLLHLAVRDTPGQTCAHSQLLIQPLPAVSSSKTDYFGNTATFFTLQEPHPRLTITAVNLARLRPQTPPEASTTLSWEETVKQLSRPDPPENLEACQFLFDSPYVKRHAELADYARPSFSPGRPLLEAVLDLTRRIHTEFRYDKTATNTATPVLHVLHNRRGVCQDFAHLQIACLRSLGVAARYVSGYLLTRPPAGQPRLVGADASHAWLSAYCPGAGWIDVDPTNNMIPGDKHIVLAWGRDYDDVCPIKGVILGGGKQEVNVAVDVVPVEDGER
jgi:transglutaminase-like putative cysteine protease